MSSNDTLAGCQEALDRALLDNRDLRAALDDAKAEVEKLRKVAEAVEDYATVETPKEIMSALAALRGGKNV